MTMSMSSAVPSGLLFVRRNRLRRFSRLPRADGICLAFTWYSVAIVGLRLRLIQPT